MSSVNEPDSVPIWVMHLVKYRSLESPEALAEVEREYAAHDALRSVGSRIIMKAWVTHTIEGGGQQWDRVGVAQLRDREARAALQAGSALEGTRAYMDKALQERLRFAMVPILGDSVPVQRSAMTTSHRLILIQVVADVAAADLSHGIEAIRIGRFRIQEQSEPDQAWAEARFHLTTPEAADEFVGGTSRSDSKEITLIARAEIDDLARSLQDPTRVRF